jgi:hypothetical protein
VVPKQNGVQTKHFGHVKLSKNIFQQNAASFPANCFPDCHNKDPSLQLYGLQRKTAVARAAQNDNRELFE